MLTVRARAAGAVAVALVALVVLIGCSGGAVSDEPLVLVTRTKVEFVQDCVGGDGGAFTCTTPASGRTLRTAGGTAAQWMLPEEAVGIRSSDEVSVTCGGREFTREVVFRPVTNAELGTQRIELEDGRSLTLSPTTWWFIGARGPDDPHACFTTTGRWEGTGGALEGRSGSYSQVDDGLQTTLTFVDGST